MRTTCAALPVILAAGLPLGTLGGCSGGHEAWTNDAGMRMVHIAPGNFRMTPPDDGRSPLPRETGRTVTITQGFWLSATEVTQAEWESVVGPGTPRFEGDTRPMESIRWLDAVRFCNRLSKVEGRPPAYEIDGFDVRWNRDSPGYRLPTEAEWEYACRAGTTGPYATGDILADTHAHFDAPAARARTGQEVRRGQRKSNAGSTAEVGERSANAWGLHDMHGNVWEYCWDWFGQSLHTDAVDDPAGPSAGERRVVRGGSWFDEAQWCACGNRQVPGPGSIGGSIGFRVALDAGSDGLSF